MINPGWRYQDPYYRIKYSTLIKMMTTKNGRKWLTSSDIKSGNAKKVTTTALKIEMAKYDGKQ
jgi:hypothetical protein